MKCWCLHCKVYYRYGKTPVYVIVRLSLLIDIWYSCYTKLGNENIFFATSTLQVMNKLPAKMLLPSLSKYFSSLMPVSLLHQP